MSRSIIPSKREVHPWTDINATLNVEHAMIVPLLRGYREHKRGCTSLYVQNDRSRSTLGTLPSAYLPVSSPSVAASGLDNRPNRSLVENRPQEQALVVLSLSNSPLYSFPLPCLCFTELIYVVARTKIDFPSCVSG